MVNLSVTDVRVLPGDSGFLLDDGQTAILYDSGFGFTGSRLADNIQTVLKNRPLEYIFLTHSHYDHALGAAHVLKRWPQAKVVAGEYAAKIFQKPSAQQVMEDLDRKFAAKHGITVYNPLADCLRVDIPVKDGDTVQAGNLRFTAVALPGHTKCSVGFYLPENKLLLSTETLGVFDGAGTVIPSYLVGYQMTLDSIEKTRRLEIHRILLPHYGIADREQTRQYLENARPSAVQTARDILSILVGGGTEEDALRYFRSRFYQGHVRTVYPVDAMELNTRIMIGLLRREQADSLLTFQ